MIVLQIINNFGFLRTHLKANICTCNGYYIYLNKSYFIHYKNQALEASLKMLNMHVEKTFVISER